jgi:endonuclease/exonuclease/phosphatase family metal-dependent hydrolase
VISHLLPATDSRGETWTYFYGKEDTYQRVDHILVSPGLRTLVQGGQGMIQDGPETRKASDHRPLCVTLEIPEAAGGR